MTGASRRRAGRFIVTTAMAAALVTAAAHLAARGIRLLMLGEFQPIGPDTVWMAPVGELVFFLVVALPFVAVALVRPTSRVQRAAVFVLGTLAVMFGALQTRAVHPIAACLLGLGVGWELGVLQHNHPDHFLRWIHRVALGFVLVFAAGTAVELSQVRDQGPLPGTVAPPDAPNVLLIILDTVGAGHLSLYGYDRNTTPYLDSLSHEATVFDDAIAPSSWTMPSHESIFTGVAAPFLSTKWPIRLPRNVPTLAEQFAHDGYRTAGFTANFTYTGPETGLARGFQLYRTRLRNVKEVGLHASFLETRLFRDLRYGTLRTRLRALLHPSVRIPWDPPGKAKQAPAVIREFLDWQSTVGDRPYFAFLNLFDAHTPYQPPPPYSSRFPDDSAGKGLYDGAVAFLDQELEVLLDSLRVRGQLDRTVLIVTADHGEGFGEHGRFGHGNSLYRELVHVPLIVRFPGRVPANKRIDSAVSLTDLGATLLDLAGVRSSAGYPGTSLIATWQDSASGPRQAISWMERGGYGNAEMANGDLASVTSNGYQLILGQDGRIRLYRYRADPDEQFDLSKDTSSVAPLSALRGALSVITDTWRPNPR